MPAAILYCADMLAPRRPDEHYAAEAALAAGFGAPIALIDHDALTRGETARAVARVPSGLGQAWYRGWMATGDQYAGLHRALTARGVHLATAPGQYRAAHELPGWYGAFAALTPASRWMPLEPRQIPDDGVLAALAGELPSGPGMVKDYVKSRKSEPEACFVDDLADTASLHETAATFIERQGADLAGGLVVRAFEDFIGSSGRAAEARVWWVRGEPVVVGPHPDQPGTAVAPDLTGIAAAVAALGCPFITTDLAQRTDGRWRVIEVGDGQVSDFPRGTDPEPLLRALLRAPHPL
ncbi:ATP-grasp domain-containing protein [Glycomyces luteolus]|uniref:ATP-grasp domain-containing protein n=1 Tax=Glycomyces luteolus TaxID=2670330 RepID=A0A9X3SPZ4_9ACTN|nr:ATP-grasp domain-containing protein [Glycomyces luteolus]MDA1359561.1 ATP-grasp domain-containing protein [Glycomyces luteolus]